MKSLVVSVRFVRLGLLLFHYVQLFRTWPTVLCIDFLFPQISHLSCDQRLVDYMWLITRRRLFQSLRCGWSFPKLNSLKGCVGEYGGLLRVYALIRCNILRYFTNPIFFRIIYGSTSPNPTEITTHVSEKSDEFPVS